MRRTTRLAVLCSALVALSTAGCGGSPTVDPATERASSPSASEITSEDGTVEEESQTLATDDFTSPPQEETAATEEAEETGSGGVAIELAGLPIGGNAEVEGEDGSWRCAVVNWTGPPDTLPPEVNLEITAMGTNPPGVYAISDGACSGGQPPCLFSPGILNSPPCGVLIQQIAVSPDDSGELFVLSGDISCAPGHESICEQFAADLAQNTNPARITWSDALTDWPTTSDGSQNTG